MERELKLLCCAAATVAALTVAAAPAAAETIFESFEGDFGPWRPNANTPLGWHITPSRATVLDGQWSLDFTANGAADDGTLWVVREIQLPPGTWTVGLEFNVTGGGGPIGQWLAIGFIGLQEPMGEADFTQSPEGENFGSISGLGWVTYSMDRTYTVNEPTTAYVAFGYTIVFEVFHTYHFDSATVGGVPVQCGNGQCFAGENPCNCPTDCGPPASSETVCDDGLDNDCEGFADCVDSDCSGDPACAGIICDGDLSCEPGETSCMCWMDCGPPPVMESSCSDGQDDDCDGMTDCDDWWECSLAPECTTSGCDMDGVCESGENCNNCPTDCISGGGTSCGNGVCEPAGGEDCLSCSPDCNGKQGGNPKNRFCCGDGAGTNPVGCDDPRCTSEGYSCSPDLPPSYCCGDGVCEGAEDEANCAIDCATSCGTPADCNDANECTIDDCVDGVCQNTPAADNTACSGGVCCGGACTAPACSTGADCADGEACTTDTCFDADTCSAYCDNIWLACGPADGCCGPTCVPGDDPDCSCLPKSASCSLDDECCSNKCRGGKCR